MPSDTNGAVDVFLYSLAPASIERISRGIGGEEADGPSGYAAVSADGESVAFASEASNIVPGDTNGVADVFLLDRRTRLVERVSVAGGGEQANGHSGAPSISSDGRYVAFASLATNLAAGDENED